MNTEAMKINNNIQETYCSFEVSKLLKEKGFCCYCNNHYYFKRLVGINSMRDYNNLGDDNISAPSHQLAIEWIRTNFNHDIEARGTRYAGDEKSSYYKPYLNGTIISLARYNSPQEATEAALLHTLQNLI